MRRNDARQRIKTFRKAAKIAFKKLFDNFFLYLKSFNIGQKTPEVKKNFYIDLPNLWKLFKFSTEKYCVLSYNG